MDYLEHSYNAYLRELTRRDELRRALTMPIGLSGLLAGAWYSLAGRFAWLGAPDVLAMAFTVLLVIGLLALLWGASLLVRSHVGYVYAYVPTAKEALGYADELVPYYEVSDREDPQVQADIEGFLATEFAENAHENAMKNNTKAKNLHNASVYLVASLGFLVLAGTVELLARIGEKV